MANPHNPDDDTKEIPLEPPARINLITVENGDYQRHLPTLTLNYFGMTAPDIKIIDRVDAAVVDIIDDGVMEFCLFAPPPDMEDTTRFSDVFFLNIECPAEKLDLFFEDIAKIKKYFIVIVAENYEYTFKVDEESTSIIDKKIELRYLH